MQCPVCEDSKLAITERQGIEIDYCPDCRGVWLDRGELDKIIERSAADAAPQPARDPRGAGRHDDDRRHEHGKHKRKSLLGELFDF